ncbi:MAG TPA: division/cell wall cluster transcriptional repressor MraZ [Anaerolineae bacterium]|nr:division/cell wall cluster transcriptional repressor MraZ [Anaerolineae bacterium]
MLTGEYEHVVDEKGRLTIPAKLRPELGEEVFVTRGLDGCLFVYPQEAWRILVGKVANLPLARRDARLFSRMICSGIECKLDRQGRILLPAPLRKYAAIEDEVIVVGVDSRLEIWSKERWLRETAEMEKKSSQFAEQLEELGV